jgi:large conductance mechanosensitive channel
MEKKEFITKDDIKKEIKKFKQFAFKEDMVKISIAVIVGGAINKVANSASNNILNPIVNFLMYKPGNFWNGYVIHLNKDIKLEVGNFLSSVCEFLIVSLLVYIVYIKLMKNLIQVERNTKTCNFCFSEIHKLASRCPQCTSKLNLN